MYISENKFVAAITNCNLRKRGALGTAIFEKVAILRNYFCLSSNSYSFLEKHWFLKIIECTLTV